MRHIRELAALLTILLAATNAVEAASVTHDWNRTVDRVWIGEEFWANPMEDWRVEDGRLICDSRGGDRNVHLLTYDLTGVGSFAMSVRCGAVDPQAPLGDGWVGFKLGATGRFHDYRDSAVRGEGLHVGVTTDRRIFIGAPRDDSPRLVSDLTDIKLTLAAHDTGDQYTLTLGATDADFTRVLATVSADVPREALAGNVALVCDGRRTIWFDDWHVAGDAVVHDSQRAFGPILFAQHTLSRGTLKLTAQLPPLGFGDPQTVYLRVYRKRQGHVRADWQPVAKAKIDPDAHTARFRIEDWHETEPVPYRLVYFGKGEGSNTREHDFHGTIRPDPIGKSTITIAAFTGNNDLGFPHADIVKHVKHFDPDLLVFTGDQVYEGVGGYGVTYEPLERATISYLRKWYQFGWEYRDLLRDTPSVCLPDDHDVFHGNLWGAGGKATDPGTGFGADAQDTGGYKMPPEFVNMVQRTQTSHHPDPYDPAFVEQGIGVYYGSLNYGGVSFAILEDRKFKSAPKTLLPEADIHNGWAQNYDFDSARDGDVPGAVLLGERQLHFLEDWAQDWSHEAWMKVVISQTLFANVATLPADVHHDNITPRLKVWPPGEYAPGERQVQDHDSNGWPQSGRNRALREMRRAFAFHVAGDQHLGSTIQYGIDDWNDASWAICVPSVANVWPRRWFPPEPGANRAPGAPKYTGEFLDGFGNRVTVHAVSNPHAVDAEPADIMHRAPGYGIIALNRAERTLTIANWPRWVDPAAENAEPYPGWPITLHQLDNYSRAPAAYLPELLVDGPPDAVIQVEDEVTGEIVYTLRIAGNGLRPPVFSDGPFTVRVGYPDRGDWRVIPGVQPASDESADLLGVSFDPPAR